jgi:hypothetical protein
MKNLTKKILQDNNIYNPFLVAAKAGNKLYIGYISAERGIAYKSACWHVIGIKIKTDLNAYWRDNWCKTFDVYDRTQKQPQLETAIAWVKEKYGLDCTEKDPFGAYHVVGTLDKIKSLINSRG